MLREREQQMLEQAEKRALDEAQKQKDVERALALKKARERIGYKGD